MRRWMVRGVVAYRGKAYSSECSQYNKTGLVPQALPGGLVLYEMLSYGSMELTVTKM